ncbi:hypothetical protein F0562_003581 [Nyssa sinensis]|uniref:Retrovirus-related Pol polyprotein from transposon TNT 1-94-like beta-barrel domain-containing protein n=1 Tax=Nyssa sinensis TaxID=561372 RepID=A0A5J5BVM5_9ASTE|nr:hypothetical protein F0562_003581 [Nyssa sinensis]
MDTEDNFSSIAPTVFDGENYQICAVRMETYLDAMDLWEAIKEDYEFLPLPDNPTMAQIKNHKDKKMRKSKLKACLFAVVSLTIFTRVISLKLAKAIWDYLKTEYEGNERINGMQVLNLIRDFELGKMKESETIKEYSDKLLSITNKVRLFGSDLHDSRIVEKILVTVLEKFEATITTLENTKDLSNITLAELLNALQTQEQRRVMRQGGAVEGALLVKHQEKGKMRKNKNKKNFTASGDATANSNKTKNWRALQTQKSQLAMVITLLSKEKGTIAIESCLGTKTISDVLYVPEIDQNLLSVGQLIEKGLKVIFEDRHCLIKDAAGHEMFKVKMRGKSFSLDPMEEKQAAFPISKSTTQVWHKKLGHFHHTGVLYM